MPPKKKTKVSPEDKNMPNNVQWCLDRTENLSFKEYIEHWDCLDKNQAQQQFSKILNDYFKAKNDCNNKIKTDYKNWTTSADYISFWRSRTNAITLLKAKLGSAEIIGDTTEQGITSLRSTIANSENLPESSRASNPDYLNSPCSNSHIPSDTVSSPVNSAAPPTPTTLLNLTDTTLPETRNYLINIRDDLLTDDDIKNHPWIYKGVDISELFREYQLTVSNIIEKHGSLPVESYIHELASLTHILFLCKDQHSEIAERIFSSNLLKELSSSSELVTAPRNDLYFSDYHFMTIIKSISSLGLEESTREDTAQDLMALISQMDYGKKRLILGLINLVQKLPKSPINDYKQMTESELWCTYFDPMLSSVISDPDRSVHLRWTNAIPAENGKSRPDAVISEKPQLVFGSSRGYGEAKVLQGSCSKLLCLDTLRLATFTKNSIDVNKLDAALAFQIHGFNISFYLTQATAKGIYTFKEIFHLRFPQSLEELPSLFTPINIGKLLEVNNVFWNICKKSHDPENIEAKYKQTQMHLDYVIDNTQDSTRRCVLRFGR